MLFFMPRPASQRPDLLSQIQMGRQLRKVERQEVNKQTNKRRSQIKVLYTHNVQTQKNAQYAREINILKA